MAKRNVIGAVYKSKDPNKSDYIKINKTVELSEGSYLSLLSKQDELTNLDKAVASGKLSEDMASEIREKVENIPDFVRFNIVQFTEETAS